MDQLKRVRGTLKYKDGCLYNDRKIIPPAQMRRKILHEAHSRHPGIVWMKRLLCQSYSWPGIDKQVKRLVKQFEACQWSAKSRPALSK